ncbi:MAG: methyltransferase [Pirellulaceae bacterium]
MDRGRPSPRLAMKGKWERRRGEDGRRRRDAVVAVTSGLLLVAMTWGTLRLPPRPLSGRASLAPPMMSAGAASTLARHSVEDLDQPIVQFPTVFWEPRDTDSLRHWIRTSAFVRGKKILEIGTGTGLLALCCVRAGAASVVATDVNPAAIENVRYNAAQLGLPGLIETRLVALDNRGAYAVIRPGERFDLIISNPPWENAHAGRIAEFALFDENFALLHSLLDGLPDHLATDGRCLLSYGCVTAIRELIRTARERQLETKILDHRRLEDLPELFLPGMLIEVTVPDAAPAGVASPPPPSCA